MVWYPIPCVDNICDGIVVDFLLFADLSEGLDKLLLRLSVGELSTVLLP
jgi:hypothetical protein